MAGDNRSGVGAYLDYSHRLADGPRLSAAAFARAWARYQAQDRSVNYGGAVGLRINWKGNP